MAKATPQPKKKPGKKPLVGTLERGLSILQYFKESPEAALPEAAAALKLSRSSTYRIAEKLHELGFLEINPRNGRWRLGREVVQLGVVALQTTDVMEVAPQFLHELRMASSEAVNLAVFDSDVMVLLFREQGPQSITISSRLGAHRPMHASGLGKAFMAAMPEDERRKLIERINFQRYSPTTIIKPKALEEELRLIAARGYAIDRGEFEATLGCVAAAIYDHRNQPVASISASGPGERVMPLVEKLGPLVAECARAISQRLGFVRSAKT